MLVFVAELVGKRLKVAGGPFINGSPCGAQDTIYFTRVGREGPGLFLLWSYRSPSKEGDGRSDLVG